MRADRILLIFTASRREAIELDGASHDNGGQHAARDAYLDGRKIKVVRFWNHRLVTEPGSVLEVIWRLLQEQSSRLKDG